MYELRALFGFFDFANEIIGKPGPIEFNTGILDHCHNRDLYYPEDDIIIIGKKGRVITFDDVLKMVRKIKKNKDFIEEMASGRSYCFSKMVASEDFKCYKINWDS